MSDFIFEEKAETVYRIKNSEDLKYNKKMTVNGNLEVEAEIILERSQYSNQTGNQANHNQQEQKTSAVLSLNFSEKIVEVNEQQGTEVINKHCLLVDRSQSMIKENKLNNVKQSLFSLFDKTKSNTQYTLISFGNSQKCHFKFTEVTNNNIEYLKNQIKNINPTGQTDIVKVLQVAHQLIEDDIFEEKKKQNLNKNNIIQKIIRYSVVLLTDGVDNIRESALNKIRENFKNVKMNYIINTLGFGDEHDPHLLSGLASHSGGKFYYIKTNQDLRPVFEEFITLQESVIVEDVDIEIQLNKNMKDSFQNKYQFDIKEATEDIAFDNNFKRIYFKQVRNNDEKNILLRLSYGCKQSDSYKQLVANQKKQTKSQNEKDVIQLTEKEDIKAHEKEVTQANEKRRQTDLESSISSISALTFVDDLSSVSIISQSQENTNKSECLQKTIESDDSSSFVESGLLNSSCCLSQSDESHLSSENAKQQEELEKQNRSFSIIKNTGDIEIGQQQLEIEEQTNQLKQNNTVISQISINSNSLQNIKDEQKNFVTDNQADQDEVTVNLQIGVIQVIFTYKGEVYTFKIPLMIKFVPYELQSEKANDRVVIQKLRRCFIQKQMKSVEYFRKGDAKKSIEQINEIEQLLKQYPLPQFPLYDYLMKEIGESKKKMEKFNRSANDNQKSLFRKDFEIACSVNICYFKDQSTSK